ncbi:MAG TPA: ankyrin repeat domain-containing protein [Steroidobacteraceae bacterium]
MIRQFTAIFASLGAALLTISTPVPGSTGTEAATPGTAEHNGPDGSTPLQWAVFNNAEEQVKRLLAGGANVSEANAYGVTPMQLAAESGNAAILKRLLAAGANVESPNSEGQTALMLVSRTGNVEAAELLIKHGANVNAVERFGGQTALMWASARRHPEMVNLLASKGANVDARAIERHYERHITAEGRYKDTDTGGLTALLYAARENCDGCIAALLAHHANINLPDPDGVGPLTIALMNDNWDVAKRLITAGADVNEWDIYGEAPLHVAVEMGFVGGRGARSSQAAVPNATDPEQIVHMLVERGANPNQQMFFRAPRAPGSVSSGSRGTTPFHRACASGDVELVKYLLAHGADINLNQADDESPMMFAAGARRSESDVIDVLRVLHAAGANVNVVAKRFVLQRLRGGTALHVATKRGLKKVMAELVAEGADVNLKDPDGLTALDYAMSRGWLAFLATRPPPRNDLAKVLRDLGANVELSKVPNWPAEFAPIGLPRDHESDIWPL